MLNTKVRMESLEPSEKPCMSKIKIAHVKIKRLSNVEVSKYMLKKISQMSLS